MLSRVLVVKQVVVERRTALANCVRCGAQAGGLSLCNGCIVGLRIELADVAGILPDAHGKGHRLPSLPDDLQTSLSRQDQLTDPNAPRAGGNDTPLVFRPHIGEAVWVLHQVLGTWVRELGGNPRGMSPSGQARWLLANLDRVQKTPDAAELADEVTDAIHQARRAIDTPNDDRIYLGPCGAQLGPGRTCREKLYGVPWLTMAHCEACDTQYRISERREWLRDRSERHLGTAPEVAGYLRLTGVKCTPNMIYGYARPDRARLKPVWADHRRRAQYLISDVLEAIKTRYVRY